MIDIDFSERGNSSTQKGPHGDYPHNLWKANEFLIKTKGHLPDRLIVCLEDSQGAEKSILMWFYSVPEDVKVSRSGNWCRPISLHQSYSTFCEELVGTARFYKSLTDEVREMTEKASNSLKDEI